MSHTDDDSDIPEGATIDDVDALDLFLDRLLAGADPAADAPAWSRDVAQLVRAAQAGIGSAQQHPRRHPVQAVHRDQVR